MPNCEQCGKEKYVSPSRLTRIKKHFCNTLCYSEYQKSHPTNTGRTQFQKGMRPVNYIDGLSQSGYRVIRGIPEHHKVWCNKEDSIGVVPRGCVIHHINGIRHDNRPENLILLPRSYHMALHQAIKHSGGALKLPEV